MWRAFFLAVGAMLVILGVECLIIDSATLAAEQQVPSVQQGPAWFNPEPMFDPNRVIKPPEWISWSLLACGAVVLLYAKTLPSRFGGS